VFTPPLRELTPETSYGFAVIQFARDVLGTPLDAWQEFAVIHGGELLRSGKPRFRKLLIIVGRQNGKTFLLDVLTKFWLFVEAWPSILTVSNSRGNAKKAWIKVIRGTKANEYLRPFYAYHKVAAGEEVFETTLGSEYYFAAPTANAAGRGGSNDRIILDELRQIYDEGVWTAAYGTMLAKPLGQIICITNQGDDKATILDRLRTDALGYMKTGKGDPQIGILEWSAPDRSDPLDPHALAYANPNLGRRNDINDLLGEAEGAVKAGGEALDLFKTEYMCIRIRAFDGAINPERWAAGYVAGDLRTLKSRLALFTDATPGPSGDIGLVGAAYLEDGRIRVETLRTWPGPDASTAIRQSLPSVLKRSGARKLGFMPNSETAKLAIDLRRIARSAGVVIEEITAEVAEVCMSFAEQVEAGQIVYGDDEDMLTDHVTGAFKKYSGEKWRFSRQGKGDCHLAYGAAGAVYLARTMPITAGPKRGFVVVNQN
jgi:hypothetical protein